MDNSSSFQGRSDVALVLIVSEIMRLRRSCNVGQVAIVQ